MKWKSADEMSIWFKIISKNLPENEHLMIKKILAKWAFE